MLAVEYGPIDLGPFWVLSLSNFVRFDDIPIIIIQLSLL